MNYIIPFRNCRSESPFGRGTRSTIALRLCDSAVVFLKDYWRVREDGALNEGETYRRLEEAKVPHIATFDRGNDLNGHETIGHLYQQKSWACKMGQLLKYKQHYRMTLTAVHRDLGSFNSSREYTQAIADAVEAHTAAYFDAHILHRDISVGNIMITDKGEGLLIDWDLSVIVDDSEQSRQIRRQRMGTTQFVSCKLLGDDKASNTLIDDRESFLWVLIWVTLKYSKTELSSNILKQRLWAFDYPSIHDSCVRVGTPKRDLLTTMFGEIKLAEERSGLDKLIKALQRAFAYRYWPETIGERFTEISEAELVTMQSRSWLTGEFQKYLSEGSWPDSDKSFALEDPDANVSKGRGAKIRRISKSGFLNGLKFLEAVGPGDWVAW